jgi:hypothetical protein
MLTASRPGGAQSQPLTRAELNANGASAPSQPLAADQHGTWYSESHDRGEVDLHLQFEILRAHCAGEDVVAGRKKSRCTGTTWWPRAARLINSWLVNPQPSPAQPSPAQPSPAQGLVHSRDVRDVRDVRREKKQVGSGPPGCRWW